MKRVLLFSLTLALLLTCVLPLGVSAEEEATPVSTVEEFEAMTPTGSYYLTGDIDFGGKVYDTYILYNLDGGTLDGRGHTIWNFTVAGTAESEKADGGIFFQIGSGTIRNLTIGKPEAKVQFRYEKDNASTYGGLAAAAYSVTVENVVMYADVSASAAVNFNVGGFFGASTNCVVRNCALYGSVSGVSTRSWVNAAGFSANTKTSIGQFVNCVNYADVKAVNNTTVRAGGIIGYAGQGVSLTNCYNFGSLSVADNAGGQSITNARLGGIIAENAGSSVRIYDGCLNFGKVESPKHAGGILGFNCNGKAVTIQNCVNYGEVKGETAGAICGYAEAAADVTVKNNLEKEALTYTPAEGVKTYGVQNSQAADGKFNVRFVGTLDSLDYLTIGFEVTAYWRGEDGSLQQKDFRVDCQKVYRSITGKAENGIDFEATAEELGGEYVFALSILNAPASEAAGAVTFVCRSFAATAESTVYGNAFACAYETGNFLFCADAQ